MVPLFRLGAHTILTEASVQKWYPRSRWEHLPFWQWSACRMCIHVLAGCAWCPLTLRLWDLWSSNICSFAKHCMASLSSSAACILLIFVLHLFIVVIYLFSFSVSEICLLIKRTLFFLRSKENLTFSDRLLHFFSSIFFKTSITVVFSMQIFYFCTLICQSLTLFFLVSATLYTAFHHLKFTSMV